MHSLITFNTPVTSLYMAGTASLNTKQGFPDTSQVLLHKNDKMNLLVL
jgi:hypothetical protein